MNFIITYIIIALGLFAFAGAFTLFGVYAERKVSAFIQDRLGPMEVGKFGSLQTLADMLKLIQKEFITPAAADRLLFILAPAIIFVSVYLGFAALPWAPGLVPVSLNIGLFYVFAIISIETLGILMAAGAQTINIPYWVPCARYHKLSLTRYLPVSLLYLL